MAADNLLEHCEIRKLHHHYTWLGDRCLEVSRWLDIELKFTLML